jgi:hypothetical protein
MSLQPLPSSTPVAEPTGRIYRDLYRWLGDLVRLLNKFTTTNDIVVDLGTKGLVLKDTQATPHYWRVTVDNTGTISTTDIGTEAP